jgi:hypothetical protein
MNILYNTLSDGGRYMNQGNFNRIPVQALSCAGGTNVKIMICCRGMGDYKSYGKFKNAVCPRK